MLILQEKDAAANLLYTRSLMRFLGEILSEAGENGQKKIALPLWQERGRITGMWSVPQFGTQMS